MMKLDPNERVFFAHCYTFDEGRGRNMLMHMLVIAENEEQAEEKVARIFPDASSINVGHYPDDIGDRSVFPCGGIYV